MYDSVSLDQLVDDVKNSGFNDPDSTVDSESVQQFDAVLKEAFAKRFGSDAQVEAYQVAGKLRLVSHIIEIPVG